MGNTLETSQESNRLKVLNKLKSSKTQDQRTSKELSKFADSLINPKFLKEHFKKNLPKQCTIYHKSKHETIEDEEISLEDSEINSFDNDEKPTEEFVWIEDYFDHFESKSKQYETIKIKLVLSNISENSIQKIMKGYLAPILSAWDLLPEYGFLHSSLIFGPWKLEWTTNELVIPKEIRSTDCIFCLDLYSITSKEELERLLDIVINVMIDWNINYLYKQNGDPSNKTGNCQQFVDCLIQKMDLQHRIEKLPLIISNLFIIYILENYFNQIRNHGIAEMFLEPSEKFMKKFDLKIDKIYFHSHEELDEFINQLLEKEKSFMEMKDYL